LPATCSSFTLDVRFNHEYFFPSQVKGLSFIRSSSGVAGSTAVGTIESIGTGVSGLAAKDSVLVISPGVWADTVTIPFCSTVKLPAGLSHEEAANLPPAVSAWHILNDIAQLKSGDVVLQIQGDTAIGAAISAIGAAHGIKVINVTADDVKNAAKFTETVKAAGPVKLAVSGSAGPAALKLVQRNIGEDGILVLYNGPIESLDKVEGVTLPVGGQIFKNQSIVGFDFVAWASSDAKGVAQAISGVKALVDQKKLSLKAPVFPQADFLKAFEAVETTAAAAVLKL
jgi:NADPH:quinone reductase-like Zn-dependent oxidoreductase